MTDAIRFAETAAPPGGWLEVLTRVRVFVVALYAVAICFERIIDVETFKPYRIVGGILILFVLIRGRIIADGLTRKAVAYVTVGVLLAVVHAVFGAGSVEGLTTSTLIWLFNIATYVAILSLLQERREVVVVAAVYCGAMLAAAVDIVWNVNALRETGILARVAGDFKNPANACLGILAATLFLGAALSSMERRRAQLTPILILLTLATVFSGLYVSTLTGSRAGAALFVVGCVTFLVNLGKRRAAVAALAVAMILAVMAATLDIRPREANILARRIETKGMDLTRVALWQAGFDAYLDHYGIGLGLDRYRTMHQEYFRPYMWTSDPRWADSRLTLHSDFVSALVEFGPVGLVLLAGIVLGLIRAARSIRERQVRAIAFAILAAAMVEGLTHMVLPFFGLWFYFALLASWVRTRSVDAAGAGNV